MISSAAEHSLDTLHCESAIFISDLHLSDDTPQLLKKFQSFCRQLNPLLTQYLIILGDFFEAYCGDDDTSRAISVVETECLALYLRGVRVAFMPGNRDFMVGKSFLQRCKLQLLASHCVINNSHGQNILLAHGDEWCTLDLKYQQFRSMSRQVEWQQHFLSQPLQVRKAQVNQYRMHAKMVYLNEQSMSQQLLALMDVEDHTVLKAAMTHGCQIVLHGHTHRSSVRQLDLNPDWTVTKYVLGDWDEGFRYPIIYATFTQSKSLELCIFS